MKHFDSGDLLALDDRGEMMGEYRRNIGSSPKFQRYMLELDQTHRKVYRSSHFSDRQDHVFVGVAMNADRSIITEDSDYGVHGEPEYAAVFNYMKTKLRLSVKNAKQYLREE